jgi:hypothetical protein
MLYDIIFRKIEDWSDKVYINNFIELLEKECIPRIKDIILEDYGFSLLDIADPKSRLAPERFLSEFQNRLEDFEYIRIVSRSKRGVRKIVFSVPDMENFDFSGKLRTIENTLEGMVGKYVEISKEDFLKATGRKHLGPDDPFLEKRTAKVRGWEKKLDRRFPDYAFSNMSPIDIFSRAEQFYDENIDRWSEMAEKKSNKELKI